MFLSHITIERYIDQKLIIIGPEFDKKNIRPVGIRLHLGKDILISQANQTINLAKPNELKYHKIDLSKNEYYIEPGQFILACTYETIQTPKNIVALLDGRSTIARLGLTTHITASVIDGTFDLPHAATLEIKNVGNLRIGLNFKDPIALMLFAELKDPVTQPAQTQYSNTAHTVAPPNLAFKTGTDL